jgi:alpha-tubulin suppressor-like RCC1 family protein
MDANMNPRNILKQRAPRPRNLREGGNAIAMIFMAIGMAGVVTYGLNNIMRGPGVTAAETGRRTIAENNLIATTQLAITASARSQSNKGDCDGDGFVEPLPFRPAVSPVPAPTGGGLLPMTIGATMSDPWGVQYGYCVWDPGTLSKSNAVTECGGAGANRLQGAPRDDQPAIAVISAGKNGTFQTTCAAYVDTTPADGKPDAPMVVKGAGSDDIVLTYTYAEANGVGGGLWKLKSLDPMDPDNDVAEIGMNIESTSTGGATFDGKVELKNKGLVLPGDPGDDSVTGACDAVKDAQMRRNTSTTPPTIEMCDFANGGGWVQVSGSAAPDVFNPSEANCTAADSGPFALTGESDGSLYTGGDMWSKVGRQGSQILFTGANWPTGNQAVRFDGSSFTVLTPSQSINTYHLEGYDDYLITTPFGEDIKAWRWDGSAITLLDSENSQVWAGVKVEPDHKIYAVVYGGSSSDPNGLYIYDFDGTNLNQLGVGGLQGRGGVDVDENGYIYTGGYPSRIYEFDGTNVTEKASGVRLWNPRVVNDYIFWSDEHYTAIVATTFDGTTLSTVGTTNIITSIGWTDGVHIFGLDGSTVKALTFDGTTFTEVGSFDLPNPPASMNGGAIWGDGNYIYVALTEPMGSPGKLYALGGFGCTSPAVPGGYVMPKPVPVSAANKYVPEPLDVGLIARWKMDESTGDVIDSVGAHNGTILNNATRAAGEHGTGAIYFDGVDREAIQITGLLDQPPALTIAGWVNVGNIDPDSDQAEIFSIGDRVLLRYTKNFGFALGYNDGSWQNISASGANAYHMNTGWHYVVATVEAPDLFTGLKTARLYVDGIKYAENQNSGALNYSGGGANTFIGRHGGGDLNYDLTGAVDDFRVYSRALGASEVAQLSKKAQLEALEAAPASVAAPALSTDNKISASTDYTCGIKKDGSLWCWGRDWPNQTLGNGPSRIQQSAPVQVTEPDTQVYYLTGTNSDIVRGGALFNKTLSPHLQAPVTNFSIDLADPFSSATGYAFTPPGNPAQMVTNSENYKLVMNLSPASKAHCLMTYNYLSRVNSTGGAVGGIGFYLFGNWLDDGTGNSTYTYSGLFNGTFNGTDRISMDFRFYPGVPDPACTGTQAFNLTGELHVPRIEHGVWTSVTTSSTHACGLKSDGSAWCWGMDSSDSLGNSGFASGLYDRPSRVVDTGAPWRQISAGTEHTCGIQSNGTLWCWGGDLDGQLGNGAATGLKADPVQVGVATDWASVTTGGLFTCAINTSGRAYCWGDDAYGQLANGAASSADQISPYLVPDVGPWVKISGGSEHACGIKSDGSLWCWGHSTARELGIDSSSNLTAPVKISRPDGWIDVSAGSFFTCALNRDGKTYCWGEVNNARLGNPAIVADNYMPTQVIGSEGSVAVTAGGNHACIMKADGNVLCWGNDTYGQLGNGPALTADQQTPTIANGFAGTPSWSWNDAATVIMAPYNANIGLNGNMLGANTTRGFGFTSPGRSYLVQDTDSNQLLLETTATSRSSQLSFNTVAPSSTTDYTTNLATKWMFNDATGTTAVGTAGGTNGTLAGTPVWNDKGRVGYSLVFDGVDDVMTVTNSATVRPAALSIAAWIKPAAIQTEGAKIISKRNNAVDNTYALSLSATGGWVTFEYYTSDNTLWKVQSTVPLVPNAWNYVVAGYDRNGSSPRARISVNGRNATLTGTPTSSLTLNYNTATPAGDLFIGSDYTGTKKFKGEIDDLRIYSTRLDDATALRLYNYQMSQTAVRRSMGINYSNNNLEMYPNQLNTQLDSLSASAIAPHLALNSTGLLGVGTSTPAARMDVAGSVRFGSEDICDTNRTGAMRYTGGTPPWSYCNGTAWTGFLNFNQIGWKKDPNALSMGDGYICAIAQTGKLYCWGVDSYGRLGNGTDGDTTLISEVHTDTGLPGWSDWKFVNGNIETTCGIRTNGTLWCWGRNVEGQLGDNTYNDSVRPVQVKDDAGTGYWSDWTYVAAGQYNVCGIRTNGRLYCWGDGYYGTNGDGTQNNYTLPHETSMNTGSPPGFDDWQTVSMFLTTGCGARANGTIYCWGSNNNRNVGINTNTTPQTRPQRVHDTGGVGTWTDWVEVSGGNNVSCGRRTDGRGYCWGIGGNRGDNSNFGGNYNGRPQIIHNDAAPASWLDWKYITTGFDNVCAIRTNGQLYCWGDDTYQQLHYNGSKKRPYAILNSTGGAGWTDWVSVKTGVFTICGVRADSTLWCWGYMDMGDGNGTNSWTMTYPNQVNAPN